MFSELSFPVEAATDSGLKCFVEVSVKETVLKAWVVGRQKLQRSGLLSYLPLSSGATWLC